MSEGLGVIENHILGATGFAIHIALVVNDAPS